VFSLSRLRAAFYFAVAPAVRRRNFLFKVVSIKGMKYLSGMRVGPVLSALFAASFALSTAAESRPLDSYKSIIDRNSFGLKDPAPPPPPPTNAPPPAKKEDFYLTGISTIGNPKRPKAYLIAKDSSKKEYDQKFYNLSIGDRQGDVTLQEIDPKGRRVKIVYQGEEKWLSMKDNGVPAPTGPGPGVPGMPGVHPPGGMGAPGAIPPPVPLPLPTPGGNSGQPQPVSYPNASNPVRRPVRTTAPTSVGAGANYNAPALVAPGGVPTIGTPGNPGVVGQPAQNPPVYQGPQSPQELAEHYIRLKANEAYNAQQGNITPPIPTL
jgi:hypothetical protein